MRCIYCNEFPKEFCEKKCEKEFHKIMEFHKMMEKYYSLPPTGIIIGGEEE